MNLLPDLRIFPETYFSGMKTKMSFAHNTTFALWQQFMSQRHKISNATGTDLFSIEAYPADFFNTYEPGRTFEKWAAVPVSSAQAAAGMELCVVPEGLYAVFVHYGAASEGATTYRYIFESWLPASGFQIDNRPHFAIMGEKYKADSPYSEEEIWIPVKQS